MGKKLTIQDANNCPKCESEVIQVYKLTQYRPKEGLVKCCSCQYQFPFVASHMDKIVRLWNKNYKRMTWRQRC